MLGTGVLTIGLAVYFIVTGGNVVGITIMIVLGAVYTYGGRGLYKDEAWGWGVGMFGGILFIVFGPLVNLMLVVPMAIAIVVMVLLFRVREHYGMVRTDPEEEARKREALRAERMENPEHHSCPHCGSDQLWIASDGSAYCENCRTGTISVKSAA